MKKLLLIVCWVLPFMGCHKNNGTNGSTCDIVATRAKNALKVSIDKGIWGTVSSIEGNCMPIVNPEVCTHCPVRRTIRIYQYALAENATPVSPGWYKSIGAALVAEVRTDAEGFYEVGLPPGKYSVVILEAGFLHVVSMDGTGGLNPVTVQNGAHNEDLVMTYKAVF
ncbi:MAG: hypothetical protein QM642_06990 [Edaphocola sp.]